jgi:hypothetical protein
VVNPTRQQGARATFLPSHLKQSQGAIEVVSGPCRIARCDSDKVAR